MIKVKQEEVEGSKKVYEEIVRGEEKLEEGIKERLKVIVKEMSQIGINVEMEDKREEEKKEIKEEEE